MYANTGETSEALRPFTGDLSAGQRLTFRFDNGWIDTGGIVGFSLDSATEDRLQFFFTGGDQNYVLLDQSGVRDTLIPFTDEGMLVDFALTGPDAYSLSVRPVRPARPVRQQPGDRPGAGDVRCRRRRRQPAAGAPTADEIRVGDTFADVTPAVLEPQLPRAHDRKVLSGSRLLARPRALRRRGG
jgi:hypothetical protein